MAGLKLFNSLSGEKEIFTPLEPGHVRLYACGPTVYSYAHIGNARAAVVFDLLVKLLRQLYPRVTHVANITDIDDRIMAGAQAADESIAVFTQKFTRIYNEDMAMLGCALPDVQPLATEHVPEMIALIETLIARGHAYEAAGHVLFNVPSYPAYGRLSNRSRDDQIAGARVDVAPFKRDPADFVLWKPSDATQPGWESPWSFGRPGWHIECSAMAEKHLGLPFDIHGGGADLKFPHHENEIAQSCCAHGHESNPAAFARVWVHNGFLTVENEKMSKSLGNFRTVHELIVDYPGELLRLCLLSAHYRQPLDWSVSMLDANRAFLDSLYRALYERREMAPAPGVEMPDSILEALSDDLNTPSAFAALKQLARELTAAPVAEQPQAKARLLAGGALLGLLQQDPAAWLGFGHGDAAIDTLVAERQAAKQAKNFTRADEIRQQLAAQGIVIEDTAAGPQWRRASA